MPHTTYEILVKHDILTIWMISCLFFFLFFVITSILNRERILDYIKHIVFLNFLTIRVDILLSSYREYPHMINTNNPCACNSRIQYIILRFSFLENCYTLIGPPIGYTTLYMRVFVLCLVSSVLIVHYWLPLRFSLTFIKIWKANVAKTLNNWYQLMARTYVG